uniref:Uncharacterized protein n=1 Tax=Rhizophora mucronata TaxID=61149 RepID=A0A2P2PE96_RHIMU
MWRDGGLASVRLWRREILAHKRAWLLVL